MNKFKDSFVIASGFVVLLWLIQLVTFVFNLQLSSKFGLLPRSVSGLYGIIFSPLLHGGWFHLISNTTPLFFLTFTIFVLYRKIAYLSIASMWFFSGIGVWIFARSAYHIGASGLIFAFATFLITKGITEKNIKGLLVAVAVFLYYGIGMIFSFLHVSVHVSWEGHLFGAIAGILVAYLFKAKKIND